MPTSIEPTSGGGPGLPAGPSEGPGLPPGPFATLEEVALVTSANTLTNGSGLTVVSVGPASTGTVVLQNGIVTFTPAPNFSGTASFSFTLSDGTVRTAQVLVDPVADAPSLTTVGASAPEGQDVPLDITAILQDQDGSESLTITVIGLPAVAELSAGIRNADGSWTLTPAQLSGLTYRTLEDFSGTVAFQVVATATESNGVSASSTQTVVLSLTPVPDAPSLSAPAALTTDEGVAVALSISAAPTDDSEVVSVTISGVPEGAVLSAGTNNGDGSWTLTPAQLQGLLLTPPPGSDADFTLSVTATSTESDGQTATTNTTIAITVNDTNTFAVGDVTVNEAAGTMTFTVTRTGDERGSDCLHLCDGER